MSLNLWRINLTGADALAHRVLNAGILCGQERRRAANLLNTDQKNEYIVGCGAIKAILREFYGVNLFEQSFVKSSNGKVQPVKGNIHICYSRTKNYCVLAVSDNEEVGVDCENCSSNYENLEYIDHLGLIKVYLEKNINTKLKISEKLFMSWTIFESLIKLRGWTIVEFFESNGVEWLKHQLSEESPVLFGSKIADNYLVFSWVRQKNVADMSHQPVIHSYGIDGLKKFC